MKPGCLSGRRVEQGRQPAVAADGLTALGEEREDASLLFASRMRDGHQLEAANEELERTYLADGQKILELAQQARALAFAI